MSGDATRTGLGRRTVRYTGTVDGLLCAVSPCVAATRGVWSHRISCVDVLSWDRTQAFISIDIVGHPPESLSASFPETLTEK